MNTQATPNRVAFLYQQRFSSEKNQIKVFTFTLHLIILPRLFHITAEWTEQQWFNTGGTRAKKYLLAPDGKFYYFKRSQYKAPSETKAGKDFKYEFWNEIIAYEVGTLLGFKILQYDIAIDGEVMGCISKSMISSENQELIEGIKYLQAYSPRFDPANKEHRTWYTFDLIEDSLKSAKIGHFINDLLELIILDAIIGNGDRHQENWAVITRQQLVKDVIEAMEKKPGVKIGKFNKWVFKYYKWAVRQLQEKRQKLPKIYYTTDHDFAPIYDNGSSLGRELLNEKIEHFLSSNEELKKYVLKGSSEIHWQDKKVSHFDLIHNLINSSYGDTVKKIIERVIQRYDGMKIEQIIGEIDRDVPESHAGYRIPKSRKLLIYKIITLRFEILRTLINEGI